MEHSFTPIIKDILFRIYGENGTEIYTKNLLIQYINEKTKSASKGSKSRSSFANLYAIYVIIEDYIAHLVYFRDNENFLLEVNCKITH